MKSLETLDLVVEWKGADDSDVSRRIADLRTKGDFPCHAAPRADGRWVLSYPLNVFDRSPGQLLAVLFGEISLLTGFGRPHFHDLRIPDTVYGWFGGPRYGAEWLMNLFGADDTLLMAIAKPSLGMTPKTLRDTIKTVTRGGFHVLKDDEMMGDLTTCPLDERLAIARECRAYVPCVHEPLPEALPTDHPVLINASVIGLPSLVRFRHPIIAHLALQGIFRDSFSPRLWATIHRLFGCDAYMTPLGDTGYFSAGVEAEREMVEAFTEPAPIRPTLPILVGGINGRNAREISRRYESPVGLATGGYIFGGDTEARCREIHDAVVR